MLFKCVLIHSYIWCCFHVLCEWLLTYQPTLAPLTALDDHCVARAIDPHFFCRGYRLDKKCMQQIATNSKQKNRLDTCELSRCHCLPQPTLQLSRRTNHAFRRIDQGQVSFPCAMPCHANLQEPKALGETSWAHLWLAQQLQVVRPPYHPHISVPSLEYQQRKTKRGRGWKGELVGCHVPTN